MANDDYPRKRAQSDISRTNATDDVSDTLEVLLLEKTNTIEALKSRMSELVEELHNKTTENLKTQLDAERRVNDAEKRVNDALQHKSLYLIEHHKEIGDREQTVKEDAATQIQAVKTEAAAQIQAVKTEVQTVKEEAVAQIQAVKTKAAAQIQAMKTEAQTVKEEAVAQIRAVKTEAQTVKEEAVAQIQAVKTKAAAQIQAAKAEVQAVKDDGAAQIQAVKTEAAAQIQAAKADAQTVKEEAVAQIQAAKADAQTVKEEAAAQIQAVKTEAAAQIEVAKAELQTVKEEAAAQIQAVKNDTGAHIQVLKDETEKRIHAAKAEAAAQIQVLKDETEKRIQLAKAEAAVQIQVLKDEAEERLEAAKAEAEMRVQEANGRARDAYAREKEAKEDFKEWMRGASRRVDTAQQIAMGMNNNMRRAIDAFHTLGNQSLRILNQDQEKLEPLMTAQKLLSHNREPYGVQIVREDADTSGLSISRYSLLEGSSSQITSELGNSRLEKIGKFVPTIHPDRMRDAFVKGGDSLLNSKSRDPPPGFVSNVKQKENSWLWMDCGVGNLFNSSDLAKTLEEALNSAMDDDDSVGTLSEQMTAVIISAMTNPIDVKNEYDTLKGSIAEDDAISEKLTAAIANIIEETE